MLQRISKLIRLFIYRLFRIFKKSAGPSITSHENSKPLNYDPKRTRGANTDYGVIDERFTFYLVYNGLESLGYLMQNHKFKVLKGSKFSNEVKASLTKDRIKLKSKLIKNGILIDCDDFFELAADYEFNSPSEASSIIKGTADNGKLSWKDNTGVPLKNILIGIGS